MNIKRPCECGCRYEDHVNLALIYERWAALYCEKCGQTPDKWCYNYREIGNLEYLEWLVK
jgi:hypothetical protein